MYINDNAKVTMSGKEYNALQQEIDELKEMYETKTKEAKHIQHLYDTLLIYNKQELKASMVKDNIISDLTKRVKKLELYETAYKAESKDAEEVLDRAEFVIRNIKGVSLWV